jgi:hypothetical protein
MLREHHVVITPELIADCSAAFKPCSLGGIRVEYFPGMSIGLADKIVRLLIERWAPIILGSQWRPVSDADKDGRLIWVYSGDHPVLAKWVLYADQGLTEADKDEGVGDGYWEPAENLLNDIMGQVDDVTHVMDYVPCCMQPLEKAS